MFDPQIIVLSVVLLIFVLNAITGFSRGLWRTLLRLGTILVSFFVAFFLSKVLAKTASTIALVYVETALINMSDAAELLELWQTNPSFSQAVQTLIVLIVPPLLFLLSYIVLKVITLIVYWILAACFSIPKAEGNPPMRLAGLGVSLVIALVGTVVFVTPVLGYTNTVKSVMEKTATEDASDAQTMDIRADILDPITTAPVAAQVYNTLGKVTFSGLTSTKWEDEKVVLEEEIDAVLTVTDGLSTLTENEAGLQGFGDKEAAGLKQAANGVGDSRLLSVLLSDILKSASTAWLKGETFLGMQAPATEDVNAKIILNGFLTVFSTSTPQTVGSDFGFVADMIGLLAKHEMFALLAEDAEDGAFVRKMAESTFLEEALALLHANERMKPLQIALSDVGTHMLVEQLGIPDNYFEEHPELMDTMSELVKEAADENGTLNKEVLASELDTVLEEYEVELEPAAIDLIAAGFAEEFTADELTTLSPEEIAIRLVEHFTRVQQIGAGAGAQLPEQGTVPQQ